MPENKPPIYLDYAATTPVDPRVLEAMLPYFNQIYGNPSSVHRFGQQSEGALERARLQMAEVLNCLPKEVIFTACGSESDNLALRGAAFAGRKLHQANHILISPVEHHAVSRTAQQLAEVFGFEVELLPVDKYGRVHPETIARQLRDETAIVSIIYANNEIGSLNPIAEMGAICRERGIPFHTDAVQAAAYLPVNVQELGVSMMSLGAHKFYGPKGIGALYVREGTSLTPTLTGGSQENGLRAGTSNIPLIVGMAQALYYAQDERTIRLDHLLPLRDHLIAGLLDAIPDARLTGHPTERLPNHASFALKGVDGNALLMLLDMDGFACSSGSACKTGDPEPSEVLLAMGITPEWALGSLRVTLGMQTTREEVDQFLRTIPSAVARARGLN